MDMTKLTAAPQNNRFHSGTMKTSREKGERVESIGNGLAKLYIDGKFVAIIEEA